jgi:hypothetical protein
MLAFLGNLERSKWMVAGSSQPFNASTLEVRSCVAAFCGLL